MKTLFLSLFAITAITTTAQADSKTTLVCVDNEKTYVVEIYELHRARIPWDKSVQFALVTEQGRNAQTTYLDGEFSFYISDKMSEDDSTKFVIQSKYTTLNCKKNW